MIIAWWDKKHDGIISLVKDDALSFKNENCVSKRKAVPYEIEMYNRGIRTYNVSKLKDGLDMETFTHNITRRARSSSIETKRILELLELAGRPVKACELDVAYWRKYREIRTMRQIHNRLNQMKMHGEIRVENIPGKGWQIKKEEE